MDLESHSDLQDIPTGRYNISPDLNLYHMHLWKIMVTDFKSTRNACR